MFRSLRERLSGRAAQHTPPPPPLANQPAAKLNPNRMAPSPARPPRAIPPRAQPQPEAPVVQLKRPRRPVPWQQVALVGVIAVVALTLLLAYDALQPRQPRMTEREVQAARRAGHGLCHAAADHRRARVSRCIAPSVVLITTRGEARGDEEPIEGLAPASSSTRWATFSPTCTWSEGATEIEVIFADGSNVEGHPRRDAGRQGHRRVSRLSIAADRS